MREPIFKVLLMDPGTEGFVALAKKSARKRIVEGQRDGFTRAIYDKVIVDVRSMSAGDETIVRIMARLRPSITVYGASTIGVPSLGRTLRAQLSAESRFETLPGGGPLPPNNDISLATSTVRIFAEGVLAETYTGTHTSQNINPTGGGGAEFQYETYNHYPSIDGTELNGVYRPLFDHVTPVPTAIPNFGVATTNLLIAQADEFTTIVLPWVPDTEESIASAVVRERARRKKCSEDTRDQLSAGTIPELVRRAMSDALPNIAFARQEVVMSVSSSSVTSGSGDDQTVTRTVTLSFSKTDPGGSVVSGSQVVIGTRRTQLVTCRTYVNGNPYAQSTYTRVTYTNWLNIDQNGKVALDTPVPAGFANDQSALTFAGFDQLARVVNGEIITGAANSDGLIDGVGNVFSPPMLLSADTRVFSYPALYTQYRDKVKRLQTTDPILDWVDVNFPEQSRVDVFLISTIHEDLGDLGMYPRSADLADAAKLTNRIDRKYTFQYDYKTDAWALLTNTLLDKPLSLPYQEKNAVFRLRSGSLDLFDTEAREQAKNIKENPGEGDNPVFFALIAV